MFVVLPFGLKTSAAAFVEVASEPARRLRELSLVEVLLHCLDEFCGSPGRTPDYGQDGDATAFGLGLPTESRES